MANVCIYCGGPANSKEHIIASQIVEILAADPRGFRLPTNLKMAHSLGGPIIRTKRGKPGGTRSKPTLEFTLQVCARCNNTWMNDVDKAALPYLAEMIRGRPTTLGPSAQAKVAAWIAKVAVTSRPAHLPFGSQKTPAPIAKAWTDWLYTHHTPLPDWHVWLARYDGSEPVVYQGEDVRVEDPRGAFTPAGMVLAAHGLYATLVLGCVGMQVLGIDGPLGLPLELDRGWEHVVRIWPPQSTAVFWPPPQTYDDAHLSAFVERLKGPTHRWW